ncbi:NAD(P)H-dependent oxidoreductase [Blautia sp. RD014234]|nr:NAD(P)H-dependent oxidoreductase [Blautia parvula]
MKILSISATNIQHSQKNSMSLLLCNKIAEFLNCKEIQCEVIDLRDYTLHPCIGCGKCFSSKRCSADSDFNKIYNKITRSDGIFLFHLIMLPFLPNLVWCWRKWSRSPFTLVER